MKSLLKYPIIFLVLALLFIGCGSGSSSNSNGSPLASFTVLDDDVRLRENNNKTLQLQGIYRDGSTAEIINSEATFKVADTGVASVDSNGKVKAIKEGNTTLQVTYPKLNSVTLDIVITKELNTSNLNKPVFGSAYISYIPDDATLENYDEYLFAMVTGNVLDNEGNPVSDVTVQIKRHKEYGSVKTDESGSFAIPVEGGRDLIVRFSKQSYTTIDRNTFVAAQEWTSIADVALFRRDDKISTIDLNSSGTRIHTSNKVRDSRGERAATLVFEKKNKAKAVDAKGNERELTTINLRATEFQTPESMPADLPSTTAFTYCADITVDGTKDGEEVVFDEPIAMYVDNFLNFEVGRIVPVGYYDRNKEKWVGSENGVVARLLDTNADGKVDALDVNGDGLPDDLNKDGSYSDEVAGIQDNPEYQAGKTYWRVMITHLTPWDHNWPYAPDGDVVNPDGDNTQENGDDENKPENDNCNAGSYVTTKTRVMHDDIHIAGVSGDVRLHYSSKKTEGYVYSVGALVNTSDLPSTAAGAQMMLDIAGKHYNTTLERGTLNDIAFDWDGKDKLGNRMSGIVNGKLTTRYLYKLSYLYACTPPKISSSPSIKGKEISYDNAAAADPCSNGLSFQDGEIAWAKLGVDPTGTIGNEAIYYDVVKDVPVQVEDISTQRANVANGWSIHDDLYLTLHPQGYLSNAETQKYIEVRDNLLFAVDNEPTNRFSLPKAEAYRYYAWGIGTNPSCGGNRNRNILSLEFDIKQDVVSSTSQRELGCFNQFGGFDLYSISHMEPYDLLAYYVGTSFENLPEWYIDASITPWGLKKKIRERIDNNQESVLFNWHNTDNYNASQYASWQANHEGMLWASRIVPNELLYQKLDTLYPDYAQALHAHPLYADIGININDIVVFDGNLGYVFDASTTLLVKIFDNTRKKTIRTYEYDAKLRLTSITDQFDSKIKIDRDYEGKPTQITAPNGQVTRLYVDYKGDLTTVTYEDSLGYQFSYNDKSLLTSKRTPNGNYAQYFYDSKGRTVKEIDTNSGEWQFTQTRQNNATEYNVIKPQGDKITYVDTTDVNKLLSSSVKLPSGYSYSYTTNDKQTDTNALKDGVQTRTVTTQDPLTLNTIIQSQTVIMPSGLTHRTTQSVSYTGDVKDPSARTISVTTNGKTTTVYNDFQQGTVTAKTPIGKQLVSTYDLSTGLTTQVKYANLLPTTYEYDTKGRLTKQAQGTNQVSYIYNIKGNIDTITDAKGLKTSYAYDLLDRVTSVTYPSGNKEQYSYDSEGNVLKYTTPKKTEFDFEFNPLSQRTSLKSPSSKTTEYSYNKNRDLATITSPSGKKVNYTYTSSQLSRVSTPEANYDYTYLFDDKIKSIVTGSESVNYEYDGALLTKINYQGALNQDISFAYNNDFNLASTTYAGKRDTYTYDNDNLLSKSGSFDIQRDANTGFATQISDGTFTKKYQYDNMGYITSISDNSYAEQITSRYDNSNIKEISEGSNTYAYEYDNLNRLTKVTKNSQVVEQYQYDAQGNREKSIINGTITTTASYNNDDELISYGSNSYTYDSDGYLKTKTDQTGTTTYTYGTLGELRAVSLSNGTTISYSYNANNQRVAKSVNNQITEKYLWLNLTTLLAVYDGNNNLKQRFVYADSRTPVAYTDNSNNIFYLSYNHLGTLKAVTNANGNILKSLEYDSFGNILSDTNPTLDVHLGFAGGLYDKETKLTRFGHRDYDAQTGRWTAKDPIDFSGGDSNLYGYVLSDPINFVDPTGEWVWVAVGAVIGAAINVGVTLYTNPQASARELVGAAIGGAIGGAIGSLAGPFGGTVSKAISGAVSKSISIPVNAGVSALGGGLGQAAQNAIDPCNYKNPLNAALASGIGGGVAGFIPTNNLNTISQARHFGMGWGGNALSENSKRNLGATVTSVGIGAGGTDLGPFKN